MFSYSPLTLCNDRLQRQLGNSPGRGLLFRKKEQTGREGSRRASASYAMRCAGAVGTARAGTFRVPTEDAVRKDQNAACLRRAQASSLDSTSTSMLDNERNDALIALAVLDRCRRHACWSVEVRARMVCLLITWRDQVTLSQVVDEQ